MFWRRLLNCSVVVARAKANPARWALGHSVTAIDNYIAFADHISANFVADSISIEDLIWLGLIR